MDPDISSRSGSWICFLPYNLIIRTPSRTYAFMRAFTRKISRALLKTLSRDPLAKL